MVWEALGKHARLVDCHPLTVAGDSMLVLSDTGLAYITLAASRISAHQRSALRRGDNGAELAAAEKAFLRG
jgi:hypothetical protein